MIRRADIIAGALIFAATLGVYARTFSFNFVAYDDNEYVYDNPNVSSGLSLRNLSWAFTTGHSANWHPVTWISHMLDVQIHGVGKPGSHHATNVLLHALNAVLLYALVRRFTRERWIAVLFAGLFAWHPLRVESVAWISERKDLLAGFFWLTATHAYVSYTAGRERRFYLATLGLLALGLMSKPMLVTFPFALLLLDLWPLRRIELSNLREPQNWKVIVEKLPMLALVIASSIVTYLVQSASGAVATGGTIPLPLRLQNAAVAVITYLGQLAWPVNLSFFYPHPALLNDGRIETWKWIACLLAILICSAVFAFLLRRRPVLFVGWFFFLGTLIPVIGIVQVGVQAHADRYTYIPMLGISIILVSGLGWLASRSDQLRPIVLSFAGIGLLGFALATRQQVGHWKDTRTLMTRALEIDPNNFVAHNAVATVLDEAGFPDQAQHHYTRAVEICRVFPHAEFNLANLLSRKGDTQEALRHFNRAVKLDPRYADAYNNYGTLLEKVGRSDDAIAVYRLGVKHCPNVAILHHNLAASIAAKGDLANAIQLWQKAALLDPSYSETRRLLGIAFSMSGNLRGAIAELRKAIDLAPNDPQPHNDLAWILATTSSPQFRDPDFAVKLAERACELTERKQPVFLDTLAAAYAAAGQFDLARETIALAIATADSSDSQALLQQLRSRQALYEANQPYSPTK